MASSLGDVVKEAKGAPIDGDDEEVTVDFSGAVDFQPVAKGKYGAILVHSEQKVSQKGDQMLKWQYEIIRAEDEDNEEFVGRKLTRTLMLVGKGAGITRSTLRAHGVHIDGDQIRVSPGKLIRAAEEVRITVGHRAGKVGTDFEGRTFDDITEVSEIA